jgi:hypothetical protein
MPLDLAIRYAPMVEFVRRQRPASILEVGSGVHGIAYYLEDLISLVWVGGRSAPLRLSPIRRAPA